MATRKFFNIVPSANVRKFWTVIYPYREDRRVACVVWGRMGTQGQSKVQEFKDPGLAKAWVDARVRDKQGHGYVEGESSDGKTMDFEGPVTRPDYVTCAVCRNPYNAADYDERTAHMHVGYSKTVAARARFNQTPLLTPPKPQPLPEFPLTTQRVITLDED